MSSINKSIQQITALEELAHRDTLLNKLAPSVKLIITFIYVITVISFRPLDVSGLVFFASFPVFLMIIGEIPFQVLLSRCMIALPFAFFAGLSNLFLEKNTIFYFGKFGITEGEITFTSLMLKAVLTVMAVLLLVASTSMNDLIYTLISLHIPSILVIQIMMTYRYMSVLLKEASLMYHAYLLRAPKEKSIKLNDMGTFLGQMILRSIDRAERIYHAMQCRGFNGGMEFSKREKLGIKGWITVVVAGSLIIILRVVNINKIL
ncbi:MAG: cobalt ECF transporter T component CbiQ [Herbinix sp.]|nr:cobalt ECF transporter T component CbiQ [Herbinix sp.]